MAGDLFHPGARGHGDEVCADAASHVACLRRLGSLDPTLLVYGTHTAPAVRPEPLLIALANASESAAQARVYPPPSRLGSDVVAPTADSSLAILRANAACSPVGSVPMPRCCATHSDVERIAPAELAARMQARTAPNIIDVRSLAEFDSDPFGRIPGSLLVPLEHLEAEAESIKALSGEVVLTCRTTLRSVLGAETLRRAGVGKVSVLTGGIIAWRAEGLEVETGREEVT